ncbi:hypothetical protein CO058_01720 [candidate division WWE3 bacterium CG_4_9_14_0_2_um_filter_35_11]|uniref:histidine kinase n=1 Tax=candidate division WWE3 bacterium CG_4_9_14_0_2_um_filter_35_11 TaxID=1975077 RepID=A0A2M8EM04_UNCKA|nr:MAG: hypothetical protein COV25_03565 [candidate division WWE3 bacterium CG10_big_fil_rev_8_21_14_0_10_35_32]PJC23776.1 MAG: hypothetical protein CO058_01720 [candidate division WWE3 bacterium CG_4_9_14_0_2_um_filter_35_11]
MIKTLRGRLSVWYISTVVIILLVLLTSVSGLFLYTLQDQIDHHIHIAVNEAHQIVQDYKKEERYSLIENLVSAQGMTVIVLSPDGSPMLETNSPDVALVTEHQLQKILVDSSLSETIPKHFTENNVRFAALPVDINFGKGLVAVGYSTKVIYSTFYKLLGIVFAVVFILVFPLTVLSYKLLKKQLFPLEDISKQAKLVTSSSQLSKRIKIENTTMELQTIQNAFNVMLSKLESIFKNERDFFSDAAHTLKTPLAVMRAQVENLSITQESKDALLSTIDLSNDSIEDLLFLSRIESRSRVHIKFSLSKLVKNFVELATTLGEDHGLTVSSQVEADINIQADMKLLQRALSNVIHNAVQYNKEKGTIAITLKKQMHKIILTIEDTGLGISKHDQKNLFKRFFRGSNVASKGFGLGLAISKAAIESSGGKISISSSFGAGTTVIITF